MKKESKEMEYEEAPCGFVKIYDYKEPFMPFREGFGFLGALMFDGETDKVQCHFCGDWFHQLGNHLHKEHNMSASAYKEAVDLRQTTALIGEKMRAKLIASGIESRKKNLITGGKKTEETKRKISETLRKNVMQTKNQRGTCPLQLLDRLQKRAKELGRTPTTDEVSFLSPLILTYGSFSEACRMAGLEVRKVGSTVNKEESKITFEVLVRVFSNFYVTSRKLPTGKQVAQALGVSSQCASNRIKILGRKKIIKAVMFGQSQFHGTPERIKYSKNELLDLAKTFIKTHSRMPSTSDCKRGLLPHASRYIYHFGGWSNVLQQLV